MTLGTTRSACDSALVNDLENSCARDSYIRVPIIGKQDDLAYRAVCLTEVKAYQIGLWALSSSFSDNAQNKASQYQGVVPTFTT